MNDSRKWWTKVGGRFVEGSNEVVRYTLLFIVSGYRTLGTAHFGGMCRFQPGCSEYAVDAIRKHKPSTAIKLIGVRIAKCRPGGQWGYDPVPGVSIEASKGTI